MPAAAITSASPSLAQVTPMAPAASSLAGDVRRLLALMCGRQLTPCSRQVAAMRAILASSMSRSTSRAGVSSSALVRPIRASASLMDALLRRVGARWPSRRPRPGAASRGCRPHRSRTARRSRAQSTKWRIARRSSPGSSGPSRSAAACGADPSRRSVSPSSTALALLPTISSRSRVRAGKPGAAIVPRDHDRRAGSRLQENGGERLARDLRQRVRGPGRHDAERPAQEAQRHRGDGSAPRRSSAAARSP